MFSGLDIRSKWSGPIGVRIGAEKQSKKTCTYDLVGPGFSWLLELDGRVSFAVGGNGLCSGRL